MSKCYIFPIIQNSISDRTCFIYLFFFRSVNCLFFAELVKLEMQDRNVFNVFYANCKHCRDLFEKP